MKSFSSLVVFLFVAQVVFGQKNEGFTVVKTNVAHINIPGEWKVLNKMDDSGQVYLQNEEMVIIAVAQNLKKAYSFYKAKDSDFENVMAFYKWDSDYRKELKFETAKLKENAKESFVIWKFNDGKLDNVFLFGSVNDSFLNLLVYTNKWDKEAKELFLEKTYLMNK
jgi:hypothetical protein